MEMWQIGVSCVGGFIFPAEARHEFCDDNQKFFLQ